MLGQGKVALIYTTGQLANYYQHGTGISITRLKCGRKGRFLANLEERSWQLIMAYLLRDFSIVYFQAYLIGNFTYRNIRHERNKTQFQAKHESPTHS